MSVINSDIMFGNYSRPINTYDGLWDDSGQIRPDWLPLFQSLQSLGKEELSNRHSEIQRILRENGVTYNVYGDPAGLYRSWKLDAVPSIIDKKEWEFIERALIQRATLLNIVLTSIYGDKSIIKNGLLPSELIYNHNGFLRECEGIQLPGSNQLFMYAADIARDKDGKLWILNDRTQAPSGTGYSLENRNVISRVIPEIFNGYQIRKLNGFFDTLYSSLMAIAPRGVNNPRIVILTPGPDNETYFEHAYLSAYLGFDLVHGEDLTVRNGFVWLKTIQGLEKVDVILRRVDDSFCDPLELRQDSRLGISGLLEVIRNGNVVVANPLGSSVLENTGMMPFLPRLCKHFFNEELLMPSLNTWWCGQESELSHTINHIDDLTVKMMHSLNGESRTVSNGKLGIKEKETLKKIILEKPYMYAGQEQLKIGTVPSFINGDLDRRFSVLRCFLVAKDGGYEVMPGGLTRSSVERDVFKVSNQYGGISKDTWVLGPEPERSSVNIIIPNTFNTNTTLPSRVAENVFWAGRYSARAKITARFLKEIIDKIYEGCSTESDQETLKILLASLTHLTMTYLGFIEGNKYKDPKEELLYIILSTKNSGSVSSTIQFLKRTIFAVRNRWASDTWHIIDHIEQKWEKLERAPSKSMKLMRNTMEKVVDSLTTFMGVCQESFPRDNAFTLLNKGRRIEKSLLLISQLRSTLVIPQNPQVEYNLMEFLLSSNMSLGIYRSRYRSHLQLEALLDLLIYDVSNPSSLLHQLEEMKNHSEISPGKQSGKLSHEEKIILEAYAVLQKKDPDILRTIDPKTGIRKELDDLLSQISELVAQISNVLVAEYFTHSDLPHQLFKSNQSQQ